MDADGNQQFNQPPDVTCNFGGLPGDIPISGDWAGNGFTSAGIYRSSNGSFLLDSNGDGVYEGGVDAYYTNNLGLGTETGAIPVAGDWNGDGRTKVGLYIPSYGWWYLDYNGDGVWRLRWLG
jgi:hypothetical protein